MNLSRTLWGWAVAWLIILLALAVALVAFPGCQRKPDPTIQLIAQRDSARVALLLCAGRYTQSQAQQKYEEIRRNPASALPDSILTRELSDPYHLHTKGAGR